MPKFHGESDEADWWASRAGRQYVKRKSTEARSAGINPGGSAMIAKLNKQPRQDIARAPTPPHARASATGRS